VANYQKFEIIGHVGRDAEMRFTSEGKPVTTFSVAYTKPVKPGADELPPMWFDVTAWEKLAEVCNEHVTKGMLVFVSGPIMLDTWTDKLSHEPRSKIAITAREVVFLSRNTLIPADGDSEALPFE